MAKQETWTKGVPGAVAPETVHVAQSGSALASGSHRQPFGVTARSASGAVEYNNAGRANFQTPHLVVQGPVGAGAAQSQFTVLQPPAGLAQCSPGATDVQTPPGVLQNPSVHTPNQSQGNTAFASFLPLNLKRLLNKETRMLGVIQILIGLIHIFSAIKPLRWYYESVTLISGYPVWGGISFIVSGSLSVYAETNPDPCMVNGSIGMNVVSAAVSLTGVSVILADMFTFQSYTVSLANSLLPFALLEFCLTCAVSHLGCQAVCWDRYLNVMPVPVAVSASTANSTANPANLTYLNAPQGAPPPNPR